MKIENWKLKINKGFTMIELLIVVAVLGILAVAVLSAINPIEQINRGRDTGTRSDAEQLLSAIDRYNTTHQLWPWQDAQTDEDAIITLTPVTLTAPAGSTCSMLANLGSGIASDCTGADEIKAAYINRITAANSNALNIYYGGAAGQSVYVCFNPQSGSFKTEADNRCGTAPGDYPAAACGTCPESNGDHTNCICLP